METRFAGLECQNISSFVYSLHVYMFSYGRFTDMLFERFFIIIFSYDFINFRKVICMLFIIITLLSFNLVFP